ncbi:hypothetical protein JAAARDRAFT_35716 [Jaapia argillacea MUCL 33604]|uniref:SUN domain-containing protein n=1 Tax=Jaapia argillacea MUCL 33604 TaxID=933084 RepID=A0A067PQS8_9AGAM|nr:hypothetical protein JAAARDRAFT_35716 [Jaapia argillacea MUCL 33604]
MSFSGTPLGQGRRLDHHTFLNKPNPNHNLRPPNSPPKSNLILTSYACGAPTTIPAKSPPKPHSSTSATSRDSHPAVEEDDVDEPALVRFQRLKQREQVTNSRGPRTITSPPNPTRWSVKDTSVNIAAAFNQAVSTVLEENMPPSTTSSSANDPNASWASGRTAINANLPRSTSVDYEKETQSTNTSRRLAAPPSRLAAPRPNPSRRTLVKTNSVRHVPDSEGEDDGNGEVDEASARGKSPFEQAIDLTKRALAPATFYLRQRLSQEPPELPEHETPTRANGNGNGAGHDSSRSYDYSAEEREFQAAAAQNSNASVKSTGSTTSTARRINPTHRRNRMSVDKKAYKPSVSDLEQSDEDFDDDEKKGRRRRKKKKEPVGGPLTTLPVAGYDKRRKRKSKGGAGEEDEEDGSESDDHISEERHASSHRESQPRGSIPPPSRASVSRASLPRGSLPPQPQDSGYMDFSSMDQAEQGLTSIEEADEEPPLVDGPAFQSFDGPSPSFSIGAMLGKAVYWSARGSKAIGTFFMRLLSAFFFLLGRVLGTALDVIFFQPARWISHTNLAPVRKLATYLFLAACIYAVWFSVRDYPVSQWLPARSAHEGPIYRAPEVPAADIAELSKRLSNLENALSGLSLDTERTRTRQESESRTHVDLMGRLGNLETRVRQESQRAAEVENQVRIAASQGLKAVKEEIHALNSRVQEGAGRRAEGEHASDEEARVKLRSLEERIGSVEGGVKEALELGKSAVKVTAPNAGAAWWNKLASGTAGNSALTIKSTDGQDVTGLISHLVDSAVSRYSKDTIARPDFAMHAAGARVVPSLTSETFEMKPANWRSKVVGLVTGSGFAIGRPPVTALHHELHAGYCWPFAGSEGQLGVMLSHQTFVSDVTIDHVAKEVAFDMRSAPREMELWGMVEGKDNLAKLRERNLEKARRNEEARQVAEEKGLPFEDIEETYPRSLPTFPPYMRIANFTYDIHSPNNIQTFSVPQEIRDLGIDFGMVVLRVRSNWGMDDYTCLYRLRVHGERMGETPLPYPEESS